MLKKRVSRNDSGQSKEIVASKRRYNGGNFGCRDGERTPLVLGIERVAAPDRNGNLSCAPAVTAKCKVPWLRIFSAAAGPRIIRHASRCEVCVQGEVRRDRSRRDVQRTQRENQCCY